MSRPSKQLTLFGSHLFNDESEISLPDCGLPGDDIYDHNIKNFGDLEKLQELAIKFIDKILKEDKNV